MSRLKTWPEHEDTVFARVSLAEKPSGLGGSHSWIILSAVKITHFHSSVVPLKRHGGSDYQKKKTSIKE
ncbi:MAG TPA: hypothetical protein VN456_18045 [Desulfosporosinus sp.]|nr:hypothetical protein [Desulfosporosinus sp.]